ncbi:hypothetical protein TWF281_006614 [Arthrobotrys megalospora]
MNPRIQLNFKRPASIEGHSFEKQEDVWNLLKLSVEHRTVLEEAIDIAFGRNPNLLDANMLRDPEKAEFCSQVESSMNEYLDPVAVATLMVETAVHGHDEVPYVLYRLACIRRAMVKRPAARARARAAKKI